MGRRVRGDCHRKEIVMPSSRMRHRISHLAFAAASTLALLATSAAFASQGPGVGPGTAGSFTQLAMAIFVYGTSALVIGTGLIGAMRRRYRNLAAAPIAVHAWRDDGAARPVFLHVSGGAFAHRVGAGI